MSGHSTGAVFLSYASQDAEVARRIYTALQAAGVDVWHDESELVGGAAWDTEIRRRIKECALFVPLISANTEQRREGYFRLEWHLADERKHMIAKGTPFLVPVVLDATLEDDAHVPDSFLEVQWTRLAGGEGVTALARHISKLLVSADTHGERHDRRPTSAAFQSAAPVPLTAMWRRIGGKGLAAGGIVLLGIAGLVLWRLNGSGKINASAAPVDSIAAAAESVGDKSFAVLPFVNLSGDPGQEYFSDGLTEEITSALARIPGLKVVGRTSAFEFKGKNQDMRVIGGALGARYLLEGSVRKAGDRLRVTAQLIQATDGVHLWTESYDRQLIDVFAIQEEIAKAIAGALRVPLGLQQVNALFASRTGDLDSYQDYLRAKALIHSGALGSTDQAIPILESVVARSPTLAPAWAALARAYGAAAGRTAAARSGQLQEARRVRARSFQQAVSAAQNAIKLDPGLPDGYLALGRLRVSRGNLLEADELYARAHALDPDNPNMLALESNLIAMTGRPKQALELVQRMLILEPFAPSPIMDAANVVWLNGDDEAAIRMVRNAAPGGSGGASLAMFHAARKQFAAAADALRDMPEGSFVSETIVTAERLLRSAPAPVPAPQLLPKLGQLGFVYLYVGAPDRTLEYLEDSIDAGYAVAISNAELWHPTYAAVRNTERFKTLVRKLGLVEYWRAKGWPEFCRPNGADEFTCV